MPRPCRARRSVRLTLERLEDRAVPAYDLALVAGAGSTVGISTTNDGAGTLTLAATAPDARLRLTDLQDALKTPGVTQVVVTTAGPDGAQPGDVTWPAAAGDLDFTGLGTGKALTFRAAHDITLTGIHFVSTGSNSLGLAFDTSAADGGIRVAAGAADSVVFDSSAVSALTVTAGTGSVTYDDAAVAGGFSYARVAGDVTITGGAITLNNRGSAGRGGVAAGGGLTVSGTAVQINTNLDAGGPLGIAGTAVALGGDLAAGGAITVTGPVTLARDVAAGRKPGDGRGPTPSVAFAGAVDGAQALGLNAGATTFQQPVGAATALTALHVNGGDLVNGANGIRAAAIDLGDGFIESAAVPMIVHAAGSGTLAGAVTVRADAALQPGGPGSTGVLPVTGNLTFSGGRLEADLGPTSDLLRVTGNVTIGSGFLVPAGHVPGLAPIRVIDFTGTLTGTFTNAPNAKTSPILTDRDIVSVSAYGPAAAGVTVGPYALPVNAVKGADFDGTGFEVRLTGPGVLGAVRDPDGALTVATHGTTAASTLTVRTTANGSDDVVRVANLFVHGSLAALSAPKVDAPVRADAAVGSVTLRTVEGLILGGPAAGRTSLTAAAVLGDVQSSGGFSAVTVAGAIAGDLTAASLGALRAGSVSGDLAVAGAVGSVTTTGGFSGNLTAGSVGSATVGTVLGAAPADPPATWAVAGAVGTITAGAVSHFALTARSLGTLSVTGNLPAGLGGDVADATFTLTGSAGAGKYGLQTVRVAGAVTGSTFDVQAGNVDAFAAGRFLHSRLYLGYTPGGAFNTGGQFGGPLVGRLNRFTTTAAPLGDPANPANFAFADGEVAAGSFGTVRLSGLRTANGTTAFGLKYHTTRGSVRVTAGLAADPTKPPADLPATAHADQFYLLPG